MKEFKEGDRVAFDLFGLRHRGTIKNVNFDFADSILIDGQFGRLVDILNCTNIKILVKKKRRVIWVNEYIGGNNFPFGKAYNSEIEAKQSKGNFYIRTIKFKESK